VSEPKGHVPAITGKRYTRDISMGKHSDLSGKNKVYIPRPDIVADRDAVDFWLHFFGYPSLMTAKALESLIYRERQDKMKKEKLCPN
jgi:hypothetical protein